MNGPTSYGVWTRPLQRTLQLQSLNLPFMATRPAPYGVQTLLWSLLLRWMERMFLQFLGDSKPWLFFLGPSTARAAVGLWTPGLPKSQNFFANLTHQLWHQDPLIMASQPMPYDVQTLLHSRLIKWPGESSLDTVPWTF